MPYIIYMSLLCICHQSFVFIILLYRIQIGRSKRCNDCHTENSSGAKKCRSCRVRRQTDKVDAEDERIRNMGLVNASKQFDRLKFRVRRAML